jgi:hypothetical protein
VRNIFCLVRTIPDFCHRKKGLSGEESMVLGHIQVAANQGNYHKFLFPTAQLSSRYRDMDQASQGKNGAASDSD